MSDEKIKLKPVSQNALIAFFQRTARRFLGVWYAFCDKKPRLSALLYKLFFFLVFSVGVTLLQYVLMTFLPYAFEGLNDGPWGVPNTPVASAGGQPYVLLGDASGLGYFIAFEIAVFIAQCINFPLQRNITYKSHGNPYFQAMWYFIGWVLISLFTNAVWGIANCYLLYLNAPAALIGFVKTMLTGFVSFIIFFFIFMLIFPDREKQFKSAKKRYEKLRERNAQGDKLLKAEEKFNRTKKLHGLESARRNANAALSLANAKALYYDSSLKRLEKMIAAGATEDEISGLKEKTDSLYIAAVDAAKASDEAEELYLHEQNSE